MVGTDRPSPPQAMSIREQIGYPDYILEEKDKHLDEEYSSVRAPPGLPQAPCPPPTQSALNRPHGPWALTCLGCGVLPITQPSGHMLGTGTTPTQTGN